MRRLILLVMLLCTLLCVTDASAARRDRATAGLHIEGVTRVTHLSTSGANLYVEVSNTTGRRLVMKRGDVDVMVDGRLRVTVSLRDKVVVPKGYCGEVLLPLRFRSTSSLTLGAIIRRVVNGDTTDVTLTYRLRGGTPLYRRTFRGEDIPISEIFDTLAIQNGILSRLEELLQ